MPRLAIFWYWTVQFIERSDYPLPHIEALNVALVHQFVCSHRRVNGGIGSVELLHLLGGAPDVDFFDQMNLERNALLTAAEMQIGVSRLEDATAEGPTGTAKRRLGDVP